jgi:hypothetical protein
MTGPQQHTAFCERSQAHGFRCVSASLWRIMGQTYLGG